MRTLWDEVLGEHDPLTCSTLLLSRASAAELGDPRSAAWLVRACRDGARDVLGSAYDTARHHRVAGPAGWNAGVGAGLRTGPTRLAHRRPGSPRGGDGVD